MAEIMLGFDDGGDENNEGCGDLPGAFEALGDDEMEGLPAFLLNGEGTIFGAGFDVKTADIAQVVHEGTNDLIVEPGCFPFGITTAAGLLGGVIGGKVLPARGVTNFPKDGIEDGAIVTVWTATTIRAEELGGKERLDKKPLFVCEVHGLFLIYEQEERTGTNKPGWKRLILEQLYYDLGYNASEIGISIPSAFAKE